MKLTLYCFLLIVMLTTTYIPAYRAQGVSEKLDYNEFVLFDFKNSDKMDEWRIINDGVMGGLSNSEIVYSDSNTAVFQGIVSLENNGGFASTRTRPRLYNLDKYDGILLRIKGDGKKYQFQIQTNDRFDGVSYQYQFATEVNTWIVISVPFSEFVPVFRGRILDNVMPISPKQIQQIGFLISDKQAGKFRLEIEWIKAYK